MRKEFPTVTKRLIGLIVLLLLAIFLSDDPVAGFVTLFTPLGFLVMLVPVSLNMPVRG